MKIETLVTIIGFCSMFIVGLSDMIVVGIITPMADAFSVSKALLGQLVTIYAIAFALLGPILTKWTMNYRDQSVLIGSFIVFLVCSLLTTVVTSFIAVSLLRVVLSGAAALITVKLLAVGSKLVEPSRRAKTIGTIYVGFSASNILGVPIGTWLADVVNWKMPFYMIAVIAFVCMVLIGRYFGVHSGEREEETKTYEVTNWRVVSLLFAVIFVMLLSNSIIFTYIEPIMKGGGLTLQHVTLTLFLCGVCGVIGTKLGNWMAEKWSYSTSLVIICLVYAAMLTSFWLFTDVGPIAVASVAIWNLFHWGTNPSIQVALLRLVKGDPSQMFSYNIALLNLGIGVGAMIGGSLYAYDATFTLSFIVAIAFALLSAGLSFAARTS